MASKTAVITGAGQGMGRAIAHKFAENGVHVILVGKTESKLKTVAQEIADKGGESTVYHLDITNDAGVEAFAGSLGDRTIDMLINNAGDWLIENMDTTTNAMLDHILGVNLRAPYILTRALLPNLRKSDNASVINIGSMAAVGSFGGISAYTAAKTGLRGLSGSLADELKPDKIRVVMISPTPAQTPMRDAASPGMDPQQLVKPETIAHMVWTVVTLPHGITTSDFVLSNMYLQM